MKNGHNLKLAEAYRAVARDMNALADALEAGTNASLKKSKRAKDPNKPKPALPAYMIFSNEKRSAVASKMEPTVHMQDVMRELASQWRDLPEAEKQTYLELAQKDKQRYETAMEKYNGTTGPKDVPETDDTAAKSKDQPSANDTEHGSDEETSTSEPKKTAGSGKQRKRKATKASPTHKLKSSKGTQGKTEPVKKKAKKSA